MAEKQIQSQEDQYVHAENSGGFFLFGLAARSRALLLLLALVGQILLTAMNANQYFLPSLYQVMVVLAVVVAAADTRPHLIIGLGLGIPATVLSLAGDYAQIPALHWTSLLVIVALYLFMIRLLLRKIFTAKVVTLDTIGYALCTYILLGSTWTLFYVPIAHLDPHAFSQAIVQEATGPGSTLVYFSFVTLTTLGYGDISPVSPIARSLAILEALTGTLFLAVLISRLIGAYSSQRK